MPLSLEPPYRDVSTLPSPDLAKTLSHCDSKLPSLAILVNNEVFSEKSQRGGSVATDSPSQITEEHKVFVSAIFIALDSLSIILVCCGKVCSDFAYDRDPHLAYSHGSHSFFFSIPQIFGAILFLKSLVGSKPAQILSTFSKSDIEIFVTVENEILSQLDDAQQALQWVTSHVIAFAYLPNIEITGSQVGNEVFTNVDNSSSASCVSSR